MKTLRVKNLKSILSKHSGRDASGHVSVRHQGGRHKRFYRQIDWQSQKSGIRAKVAAIEYDPNRTADVALMVYEDGEKRYILAPSELKVGDSIVSGKPADMHIGSSAPLRDIPIGTLVHSLEIFPGRGAQMVRSAGTNAVVLSKEEGFVQVKLPSGEVRQFSDLCYASIGQLGNINWKYQVTGKAGTNRLRGIRPSVRGVAQNPRTHPHGGGEGRSGIGMPSPKSPWGKKTLGFRTRKKKKYSNRYVLQRRK